MEDFEHPTATIGGFEAVIHNQAKIWVETEINQEEMKTSLIDANQEKKANLMEIIAEITAWRKEMTACQEVTEACLERMEPTLEETESESEHQEVPKEEATVETVKALKKQYGDQHLVVQCR
jgi:hypothetical protein